MPILSLAFAQWVNEDHGVQTAFEDGGGDGKVTCTPIVSRQDEILALRRRLRAWEEEFAL